MYILGVHTGHDAGACLFSDLELIAFCKEERVSRVKNDGGFFDLLSVDEVLRIAGISRKQLDAVAFTRMGFPLECFRQTSKPIKDFVRQALGKKRSRLLASEMRKQCVWHEEKILKYSVVRKIMGLREDCEISFSNHHYAHILGSFKYTDWGEASLYISCDGGGDGAHYSAYYYDGQSLERLYGGNETLELEQQNAGASIGLAYAYATKYTGFQPNRHEGKLTGLAAFGTPIVANKIVEAIGVTDKGGFDSSIKSGGDLKHFLDDLFEGLSREDVAASIQVASERIVVNWVKQLLSMRPVKYVGLSGGVFSNVKLNQCVAELEGVREVFIFPAMGDEGLPVGNCVDYLINKYGLNNIGRERLGNVYLGWKYKPQDLMCMAEEQGFKIEKSANVSRMASQELANGKVGAVFFSAMEMGPRALGARSILASPEKRDINDSINARLERTEFMPFAPYVLPEDAADVFGIDDTNRYACKFMTITTRVNEKYRNQIAAVVHVDGTARPQIIEREDNWLYYDILKDFKELTGIPCLVNTSFNAHEEPIINTPNEALRALKDNRVDFLVCEQGLVYWGDTAGAA
ncbi:MAG: carbamoyltransferase C-terminal domain-containing protein [Porticoccus sp.]|nr:carbamoyltransferase C-terminal domain-containing protein [Porticoccus sp.]